MPVVIKLTALKLAAASSVAPPCLEAEGAVDEHSWSQVRVGVMVAADRFQPLSKDVYDWSDAVEVSRHSQSFFVVETTIFFVWV